MWKHKGQANPVKSYPKQHDHSSDIHTNTICLGYLCDLNDFLFQLHQASSFYCWCKNDYSRLRLLPNMKCKYGP